MACLDVELCDKIDSLNTNISAMQLQQSAEGLTLTAINSNIVSLVTVANSIQGYFIIFTALFICYKLGQWVFNLIRDISLGW